MRQMRGTLAMVVISLFAVGALTLGARELLSQDAATVCPYSPPNVLGECVSPGQCQIDCVDAGGYQGTCSLGSNCCLCAL
ncbi:MAG: hypothetical protein ACYC2G_14145 [Gemmatimonadaceae bacterium]